MDWLCDDRLLERGVYITRSICQRLRCEIQRWCTIDGRGPHRLDSGVHYESHTSHRADHSLELSIVLKFGWTTDESTWFSIWIACLFEFLRPLLHKHVANLDWIPSSQEEPYRYSPIWRGIWMGRCATSSAWCVDQQLVSLFALLPNRAVFSSVLSRSHATQWDQLHRCLQRLELQTHDGLDRKRKN